MKENKPTVRMGSLLAVGRVATGHRRKVASKTPQRDLRGRPRRFSEEGLVDAALRVLKREGDVALTLRTLADELGTSHTTLYNYVSGIEEVEDKALHRLADQVPTPRSVCPKELRVELTELLEAMRQLLRQHRGLLLFKPGSAAAEVFQQVGDQWHRALLPYAPDMKTVELALGALMSTVLLSTEYERLYGSELEKMRKSALERPADSVAQYSFGQYIDAMIDLVLPGLTRGNTRK